MAVKGSINQGSSPAIKSQDLSRLIYSAVVLDVPKALIGSIDEETFSFVWKNNHHYLKKRSTMQFSSLMEGGLDMIDFGT